MMGLQREVLAGGSKTGKFAHGVHSAWSPPPQESVLENRLTKRASQLKRTS